MINVEAKWPALGDDSLPIRAQGRSPSYPRGMP